ncbi:hypothetical protein BH09ACT4_BH09ACT4_10020 [soil metagenome]
MKISVLVRAATALLLTVGMTGLGATAAFADDAPSTAPSTDSAPPASAPDPAPAPAPDPAPAPAPDPAPADPPASDPPESDPPASDPPASDPPASDPPASDPPASDPVTGEDSGTPPVAPLSLAPKSNKRVTLKSTTAPVGYVTAGWLSPGGGPPDHFSQTQQLKFSHKTAAPDLTAVDGDIAAYGLLLKCGTSAWFQVDVYYDDSITDTLLAGGTLTGPSLPNPEHLISGGLGTAWKFVQVYAPRCPVVVPGVPAVKDLCGTDNDHYGLLADTAGIAYTRDGLDIVATLTSGYVWGALPAGWVDNGDGTATYAFSNTDWNDEACIEVVPAATPTPQTCVQNVFLTEGSIQLTLNDHVHYTVTGPDGALTPVTFDALGLSTSVTLPGVYSVGFTLDPGYSAPTVLNPFTVTITAFGALCDLTTAPLVEPLVTFTPPSCTHDGSYTLANDQTPGAVLWEVNGTPGAIDGTYPATRGTTLTIHADAAAPLYGFAGGQQQDWTHTFTVPSGSACDPGFLAFTGPGPRLTWLAVALTMAGLALVLFQARGRREFSPIKNK